MIKKNLRVKSVLVLFFLLTLALPIAPFSIRGYSVYLFIYLSLALLTIWLALFLAQGLNRTRIDRRLFWIVGFFFLWPLIVVFWAKGDFFINLLFYLRFFIGFSTFSFVYFSIQKWKEFQRYLNIFLAIVLLESILLLIQRATGTAWGVVAIGGTATPKFFIGDNLRTVAESGGTLSNANHLIHWLIYGVFLSISFLIISKNPTERVSRFFLLIAILAALIFSFARAGWLGTIIGTVIFLFFALRTNRLKKRAAVTLLTVFLIISSLFLFSNFSAYFKQKIESRSTIETRNILNQAGREIFFDHLFTGVGLRRHGQMKEYFEAHRKELTKATSKENPLSEIKTIAHNTYLVMGAETGLLGLALFILVLMAIWQRMFFLLKKFQDNRYWLGLGFLASFSGHFLALYYYPSVMESFLWPLFWFMIGLAAAFYKISLADRRLEK